MTRMTHSSLYPYVSRAGVRGKGEHLSYPSSRHASRHASPIWVKSQHASYPSYASPTLTGMALQDPEEWIPEFESWAPQECLFIDRSFGGLTALHIAFSEWCMRNRSVPCTRYVFEHLLTNQGFHISASLVHSLVLRRDA
jgi:hypothetical protein